MKIRANRTPLCEVPKGRPLAQRHRALVPIVNITGSLTECRPMALWPCTQVPFPLALYPNPAFESSSAAVPGSPTCPSCQPSQVPPSYRRECLPAFRRSWPSPLPPNRFRAASVHPRQHWPEQPPSSHPRPCFAPVRVPFRRRAPSSTALHSVVSLRYPFWLVLTGVFPVLFPVRHSIYQFRCRRPFDPGESVVYTHQRG